MATASYYYQAESNFCASVSNLLLAKYKEHIGTTFSDFYHQMTIAICLMKQFTTVDIENIVDCLNDEFEKFVMSRLKWS